MDIFNVLSFLMRLLNWCQPIWWCYKQLYIIFGEVKVYNLNVWWCKWIILYSSSEVNNYLKLYLVQIIELYIRFSAVDGMLHCICVVKKNYHWINFSEVNGWYGSWDAREEPLPISWWAFCELWGEKKHHYKVTILMRLLNQGYDWCGP